jgi:hypothetical protein
MKPRSTTINGRGLRLACPCEGPVIAVMPGGQGYIGYPTGTPAEAEALARQMLARPQEALGVVPPEPAGRAGA